MERATTFLRTHARTIALEVAVNGILPFVVYSYAHAKLGDADALLASMLPPLAWSVAEFIRKRKVDIVSIFVIAGIVLSLLAFIGGGSAKFLQLRENLVSGLIALVFLGSAAIGRPLIYEFARATMRRQSAEKAASFEQLNQNAHVRRSMMFMTLVWGSVLLAQTALACVLVFVLSISAYLVVSPILGYGTMGALALWTFKYVEGRRRAHAARVVTAPGAADAQSGSVAGRDVG
jgi:intracellular septation protein A